MTEVGFYHLTRSPLERALPKLLERVLDSGLRALVLAGSDERVDALNAVLWTYEQNTFLPHGTAKEGSPEQQPIWLTTADANANRASVLVQLDSVESKALAGYDRVVDMFDGGNEEAVAAARERWRRYKDAGHPLTYWQQNERGGWEKKA